METFLSAEIVSGSSPQWHQEEPKNNRAKTKVIRFSLLRVIRLVLSIVNVALVNVAAIGGKESPSGV